MMLLWIPFLFLPLAIFWLVRPGMGMGCGMHGAYPYHPGAPAQTQQPIEIARQRLARGEITVAEFEEIKRALG